MRCLVVSLYSLQSLISLHVVLHKNLLVLLLFDTGVLSQLTILNIGVVRIIIVIKRVRHIHLRRCVLIVWITLWRHVKFHLLILRFWAKFFPIFDSISGSFYVFLFHLTFFYWWTQFFISKNLQCHFIKFLFMISQIIILVSLIYFSSLIIGGIRGYQWRL